MSMAMAIILKVLFMRKKEGKGGKAAGKNEEMCVKGKVNLSSGESRRVKTVL
jgi:hypothetical protein